MRPRDRLALLASLALTAAGVGGCGRRERPVDARALCAVSERADATGDLGPLHAEIERQLGVRRAEVRPHADGWFVPTGRFLFEEWGIFVARPGATLPASTDPTFVRRDVCVYDYTIRG